MQIAILTFDGFNELDSFVALSLLNRVHGWRATICAPNATVTSMGGVTVTAGARLNELPDMDAIVVGSGVRTRQIAADTALMARLRLEAEAEGATIRDLHIWRIGPHAHAAILSLAPGADGDAVRARIRALPRMEHVTVECG